MTVTRTDDGRWQVVDRGAMLAGPFETMAEAWRWIDRSSGSPISKSEDSAQWFYDNRMGRAE